MQQYIVTMFVMSMCLQTIHASQHTRQRSYTDSVVNYSEQDYYSDFCFQKAYHRARINNERRKKNEQKLILAKTQQFKSIAAVTVINKIKSPKAKTQSSPLLSPKRISPSQEAHSHVKEITLIKK